MITTARPREEDAAGWIAVAGAAPHGTGRPGHLWVFANMAAGLRQLGWSVLLDLGDGVLALAPPEVLRHELPDSTPAQGRVAAALGCACPSGTAVALLSESETASVGSRAAALLNVMGRSTEADPLGACPHRVFVDIDPGYSQMWKVTGLADVLTGHDAYATVGSNMGDPGCGVPDGGADWVSYLPPVVLDQWPTASTGEGYTSVATWRNHYGTVEYGGRVFGSRVHEFRGFAGLPRRVEAPFRIALDIDSAEVRDRRLLAENGWTLLDPRTVCADLDGYRRFIQGSRAEFCVAQNMYVQTRGGWFSDRSACYLASGKPVIAQDTGFGRALPTGEGLFAVRDLDDAVAAVEAVEADPRRHARAAREIAEEYLEAGTVLRRLLAAVGIG